jgi:ATP-dependent DNA helicase RecG
MLEGSQIKLAPLFGGQKTSERTRVLRNISTGSAQIIVGTQAIIHGEIPFHKLGLVVIDEQHKFGVMQRAALKLASNKFVPPTSGGGLGEGHRGHTRPHPSPLPKG